MFVKTEQSRMHISHLINLVGNNGCGPDSAEALYDEIKRKGAIAKKTYETQSISYAGMYDILIYPSEQFSLIPAMQLLLYQLTEKYED